jgi:hypothetical protein
MKTLRITINRTYLPLVAIQRPRWVSKLLTADNMRRYFMLKVFMGSMLFANNLTAGKIAMHSNYGSLKRSVQVQQFESSRRGVIPVVEAP